MFLYARESQGKTSKLSDVHQHLQCSSSTATRIVQSHLNDGKGSGLLDLSINPENRSERLIAFTTPGLSFMKSILDADGAAIT